MIDLPRPNEIANLASLLAPGLIIATIRARAITGSIPDIKDRLFSYALISTAYFAIISPLFHVNEGINLPYWLWSATQYAIIPIFLGILLAYCYQWKLSYRISRLGRLRLAHHIPAAWDYVFEEINENTFILVTMNDGSTVAGRMTRASFASSSKEERDLFIGEVWEINAPNEKWTLLIPQRSILLCGKDIRHIEVFQTEND